MSEFNLTVKQGPRRYTFRVQRSGFEVQWVDGKLTLTLPDAEGFDNQIINQVLADTSSVDRIDIECGRSRGH